MKSTKKLLGICCLGDFEHGAGRAEISYDIARAMWNKGYATEAVKAIVDYGLWKKSLIVPDHVDPDSDYRYFLQIR